MTVDCMTAMTGLHDCNDCGLHDCDDCGLHDCDDCDDCGLHDCNDCALHSSENFGIPCDSITDRLLILRLTNDYVLPCIPDY